MPIAAPRPCRHAGCGKLVRDGSGFCAAHLGDKKVGTFADPKRGSRHARGYGSAWDKLRLRILRRDAGLCQPCLQQGRIEQAKQVDHIVPKALGGTDDDDNLQAICEPCHKSKTAAESAQVRRGSGVDGVGGGGGQMSGAPSV